MLLKVYLNQHRSKTALHFATMIIWGLKKKLISLSKLKVSVGGRWDISYFHPACPWWLRPFSYKTDKKRQETIRRYTKQNTVGNQYHCILSNIWQFLFSLLGWSQCIHNISSFALLHQILILEYFNIDHQLLMRDLNGRHQNRETHLTWPKAIWDNTYINLFSSFVQQSSQILQAFIPVSSADWEYIM